MSRSTSALHGLESELSSISHEVRLDLLGERLRERGPLAVRHSTSGRFRNRATIELDDDTVLHLSLFWAVRTPVAAVESVRYDPKVGWIVRARSTAGDPVVLFAWLVRVSNGR